MPEPEGPATFHGADFRLNREARADGARLLFLGEVTDRDHPRRGEGPRALAQEPDGLSCLRPSKGDAERPNLLATDWGVQRRSQPPGQDRTGRSPRSGSASRPGESV